jgi:hypothetical protein
MLFLILIQILLFVLIYLCVYIMPIYFLLIKRIRPRLNFNVNQAKTNSKYKYFKKDFQSGLKSIWKFYWLDSKN